MSLKNCEIPADDARCCNKSSPRNSIRQVFISLLLLISSAVPSNACGPDFPNNLLSDGDEVLFTAPVANFRQELNRLHLAPSRFDHVAATNGYEQQTYAAELADLATALTKAKVPDETATTIIAAHRKNRDQLQRYRDEHTTWESRSWMEQAEGADAKRGPAPKFPDFSRTEGLPDEFADYFDGVLALRAPTPDRKAALQAWERLLGRPAAERKYKSTWAAFMLGKLWDEEDDLKAVEYFQLTRELAKKHFADSAGLAVAAIGLEARIELRREHFQRAIELFLEQFAAGDESAVQSLRIAARTALNGAPEQLPALAGAPNTRKVLTAYLISNHEVIDYPTGDAPAIRPVEAWLTAVAAADIKDVDSAERLALAAYQDGAFELAAQWIKHAPASPAAQWLQAKLMLRSGKIAPAAALLAKVTRGLPVVPQPELTNSTEFADALYVANDPHQLRLSREQMLGELGVLSLSRGEFTQALDALLRAHFWEDAAYVAERVMTTDELKIYVDRAWPALALAKNANQPTSAPEIERDLDESPVGQDFTAEKIRHLLARRLVREMRGREAQPYFPPALQPRAKELLDALDAGWHEATAASQRAEALFAAAQITRADGMELLGTELGPDWFIHGGAYEWGLTWERRADNSSSATINVATATELQRAAQHKPDPEERFHYRYHAAALAWEAAKLMPNDSDATARVLCTGGTWLKYRDLQAADLFYKTLVRRCRKTAIGAQADRMRWFPILDEAGNPRPWTPSGKIETGDTPPAETIEPPIPVPEPEADAPAAAQSSGDVYIIQRGDSLLSIARAATMLGRTLTVRQLAEANPGLNPSKLMVGQKILIPDAATNETKPNQPAAGDKLGIAPDVTIPLPSAP